MNEFRLAVSTVIVAFALWTTCASGQTAIGSKPRVGHCIGGECSWSREISRSIIKADSVGKLIRVRLIGGTAAIRRNAPIRWQKTPHDVYVFCSTSLPAVFAADTGAIQVDVLDFVTGPPAVLDSSVSIYLETCHGPLAQNDAAFARRNGYRAIPERWMDVSIRQPDEIFAVAKRAASNR